MARRAVWCLALIACGSSSAPPKLATAPAPDRAAEQERARRQQLAEAHHEIESEQQDALAAKCDPVKQPQKQPRCLPSCYETEPADPRAGKRAAGAVEIQHLACESERGPILVDELARDKLAIRPVRGRFPRAHRTGWQADLERALAKQHRPALARGDVYVVTGAWRSLEHPLTKERLRCASVSHYTRARGALDACGATGAIACEAKGNPTARAINVVHYRLAEARALHDAGRDEDCQQAALEAIAVARGLPRWRQYMDLNVNAWPSHAGYRTRFDGVLDEETLFATTARLGTAAEAVYATCGGSARAVTTAAQEQSFHTCW